MKTVDGGLTWIDQTGFPDFTEDLRDVLVVAPGDLIAVGESPGIFRSLDGGQSWAPVPNPSTATLYNIEVISGDTLSVVGDHGHVLRSVDGGGTWSALPPPEDRKIFDQFWWNGQEGYVVGEYLTRQTSDGGLTWIPIPDVPEPWTYTKIHFLDSENGWLLQHFSTFRTTDGGASWFEKHGPFLESPFYQEEVAFIDASHRFIVTFLEGAQIWETTDDGLSWTMLYGRNRTDGYTDIERLPDGSMVVCSSFGDLLRSTDMGQTWVNYTRSPGDEDRCTLEVMTFLPNGRAFAGGNSGAWLMSTDGGDIWRIPAVSPGLDAVRTVAFRTNDFGLAGGDTPLQPSRIFRTTDGGESWSEHELTGGSVGSPMDIAIPGDSICYTVSYGGSTNNHVFRSDDGGRAWEDITNEIPASGRLESIFFVDVDTGFVAGGTTGSGGNALLWKTVNGGGSWIPVSTSTVGANIDDMHWMDSATGIVVNRDGAYRTTSGGAMWSEVISSAVNDLDFRDDLHGVAGDGSGEGVWTTSDGGVTWEKVEYPWESHSTGVVCVSDGFVVCGRGTTILRGRDPDLVSVPDDIPREARLSSPRVMVMPNPFNPVATVRFQVPKSGHIFLAVYDVNGRQVASLVSGYFTVGAFETMWDGRDDNGRAVTSGIYFVGLTGHGFGATEKAVLIR